jgi:lipid-binding SYLF domain-containing protein
MLLPIISKALTRAAACLAVGLSLLPGAAVAGGEQEVVERSLTTIAELRADANLGPLREALSRATAIVVMPQVIQTAFIVGGDGGKGVLLARNGGASGEWSYPAFYSLGSGSVGPQVGGEISKLILVVMTKGGLEKLLADRVTLGGDITVAAGPSAKDSAREPAASPAMADLLMFSHGKGGYVGLALRGAVLTPNGDANKAFYGNPAAAREIVVEQKFKNEAADELRAALPGLARQTRSEAETITATAPTDQ